MNDRNFDDLAEHFEKKIYKGQKGKVRQAIIWRDLLESIPNLESDPRNITDIGAGLGQFVIELAKQGHNVTYNDISQVMHDKAKQRASLLEKSIQSSISWHTLPYQSLPVYQPHDLILCHAVLEWLAEPENLLPALAKNICKEGFLSFCTYNPTGYTLRNLIAGNFKLLERENVPDFKGSLTPINPCSNEQVHAWLHEAGFEIVKQSGIRVFSDYAFIKRGGLEKEDSVLEQELKYSDQFPYNQIGRYTHIVAKKV